MAAYSTSNRFSVLDKSPQTQPSSSKAAKSPSTSTSQVPSRTGTPNGSGGGGSGDAGPSRRALKKQERQAGRTEPANGHPPLVPSTSTASVTPIQPSSSTIPPTLLSPIPTRPTKRPTKSQPKPRPTPTPSPDPLPLLQSRQRDRPSVLRVDSKTGEVDKRGRIKKQREVVVKKTDWEIPRKGLHGSIGFLVIYLHSLHPQNLHGLLITLTTALIFITLIDLLRFRSHDFNIFYIWLCGPLMRSTEVKGWNGVIWYLLGCVISLGVFPRDVGVVSVLTLSWSDTAASTLGRALSPYSPPSPNTSPSAPVASASPAANP